jgi:hypothetical protein
MATRKEKTPRERTEKAPTNGQTRVTARKRKGLPAPEAPIDASADQIRLRAYELYVERGGVHGQDWDDWFAAERELMQLLDRSA